ncbi:MAG: Fe-S cluster assembly protein SufD [Gammaproteobacteria bacterium]
MDHLSEAFAQRPDTENQPEWLSTMQNDAWQRALDHGLPWRKDEHWKYTSLYNLAKLPLRAADSAANDVSATALIYGSDQATTLNWFNGRMAGSSTLPEGVTFDVLDSAASFLDLEPARASVMQDLNHAFADSISVLTIANNTRLSLPVYLAHKLDGNHTLSSQRLHVIVGDNCELDLVDHMFGDSADSVNNRRLSIVVGANSQIRHTQVQQEDDTTTLIDNVDVVVGRDSHYASQVVDLGARLSRHDLGISLDDQNANCTMLAVYLPHAGQHVDHHSLVRHNKPHTHSEQRYNGVAGQKGHGVFNGKVLVQKDAQKITAAQSNQNVMLCEQAAIDTKPELEIYADDVKCSHGATIGQLDETSLFYLQSRGLGRSEAQQLLVRGFVRDIYAETHCKILYDWLDAAITTKLDKLVEQL